MASERITEQLVRKRLDSLGYGSPDNDIAVEEQKSQIDAVKRLLKNASKTGKGGKGAPEFIISSASSPDFLVVIECKADVKHHESVKRDAPASYAVDGALHYAAHLSKEFNVIALAVSGQTIQQLKVSTFLHAKGGNSFKLLRTKEGKEVDAIVPWLDYIEHATYDLRP